MQNDVQLTIRPARSEADLGDAQSLFRTYVETLGVDLSFQGVESELEGLPGAYAAPKGVILIARGGDGGALGCVAMRPLEAEGVCEMKRLYVVPDARGLNLGRALVEAVVAFARAAGHRRMVLDTLKDMDRAQRLYAAMGFKPADPHYDNPLPGTSYMAMDL